MHKINKIAFLGSADAMKPNIIINYLINNNSLEEKEIFFITESNNGKNISLFKKDNVYILDDVKFSCKDIIEISKLNFDIIICLGWPYLIPKEFINRIKIPIINCHGSYLPDYRGSRAYMHYWSNCEDFFGASIHYVTEKFDDGKILIRNKLKTLKNETKEEVHYRCCELSAIQIPYAIQKIENGEIGKKYDNEKARYFNKINLEEFLKIKENNQNIDSSFFEDLKKYKHTDFRIVKNNAPKVMILGAGILQYFLIKKVNDLGYISIVVDANPEAVGFRIADCYKVIDIKNKKQCLEYAQEMKIDAIITGATDYSVLTVSYIAKKMGLNAIDYDVAKTIKNKYETQKVLYNKGIINKNIYQIQDIEELKEKNLSIEYPVIVKPVDGSGSRGINKIVSHKDLEKSVKLALEKSLTKKCIIEPFITGEEYGVESFVYNNRIINLIVMKKDMTSPPYYAELGHNVSFDKSINKKIISKVNRIIKALEIDFGSINMDLIVNKDDVYMVDIGARMGGNLIGSHIIPLSTGVDYMKMIIDASLGKEIDYEPIFEKAISSKLITLKEGEVSSIDRNKIKEVESVFKLILPSKGEKTHLYSTNLDGCGYVICEGYNIQVARNKAEESLNKIRDAIKIV